MENLIKLYTLYEDELHKKLVKYLMAFGYEVIEKDGSYIYATHKSQIDCVVVSHIDTVHTLKPTKSSILIKGDLITDNTNGLGADDRNGIFIILELLQKGYRPVVLFTHDEEYGGIGVNDFIIDYPEPLKPVKFCIEFDREGIGEAVFYDCGNKDFQSLILTSGFYYDYGTYTDIVDLCDAWNIAGVNLSVGYKKQHTKGEYTIFSGLLYTLERVQKIFNNVDKLPMYKHESTYKPIKKYTYNWSSNHQAKISAPEKDTALKLEEDLYNFGYTYTTCEELAEVMEKYGYKVNKDTKKELYHISFNLDGE